MMLSVKVPPTSKVIWRQLLSLIRQTGEAGIKLAVPRLQSLWFIYYTTAAVFHAVKYISLNSYFDIIQQTLGSKMLIFL